MSVAISAAAVVVPAPLAVLPGVETLAVRAGGAPPFDHLAEAARLRAPRVERLGQLVLAAAGAALSRPPRSAADRVGIVLGTAFGCFLTNDAHQRRLLAEGPAGASPRVFAATVSNAAVGELAIAYGLAGPAVTLSAGAASGLAALGHAAEILSAGEADAVLAGGADALGEPLARWLAAARLAIGRPAAEGAALLLLERGNGAPSPLGTLAGQANGFEPTAGAEAGHGLAGAIAAACDMAAIAPAEIALVVSGAPPPLRALETRALGRAGVRPSPAVSPKDALGETFGAAGPLGLLAGLAAAGAGDHVLVLDVCASGHVGALVARRAG